eukprot:jgi/Pico_ML_1/54357/g4717.t1
MATATIGFPRVGARRELKFALESYWKGKSSEQELLDVLQEVERQAWNVQREKGVLRIGLDGTLYDQVLDWIFYLGLAPERFQHLKGLEQYFAMARGAPEAPALDMSKWFDTNYHYLVPELDANTRPSLENMQSFLDKVLRGQQTVGKERAVPLVIGPITLVHMGKLSGVTSKDMINKLLPAYTRMLKCLKDMNVVEVQIDEPFLSLREGLPLKQERWAQYLEWAVQAFRLATAVAKPEVQIVTHLCYSDFNDILEAIDGMQADVLTIENSRSGDEMIKCLADFGYNRDLGAGVYDVHSPVVPSAKEIVSRIEMMIATGLLKGHHDRIWINPDCGLKTRQWEEVIPSLRNSVMAATMLRERVG